VPGNAAEAAAARQLNTVVVQHFTQEGLTGGSSTPPDESQSPEVKRSKTPQTICITGHVRAGGGAWGLAGQGHGDLLRRYPHLGNPRTGGSSSSGRRSGVTGNRRIGRRGTQRTPHGGGA